MNGKRILPWEDDGNDSFAGTTIGEYEIMFDYEYGWGATFNGKLLEFPNGENSLDVVKSVCESDYISRCTEFLKLAGPGECVVNAIDLEGLLAMYQKGTRYADSDEIVQRLSAAIDAASEE
jgi:hypothetical protein